MVTEFKQTKMDMYIVGNSKLTQDLDMDTLGIQTTMNMMANGGLIVETEKESSRKHRLEKLKEGYMNLIKSKKSLK
jgi:regulatory protein YycI of two-component signal transduction system YycFG